MRLRFLLITLILAAGLVASGVAIAVGQADETPGSPETTSGDILGDEARARLIADAVKRLVTTDNSAGGRDVFDDIRVGRWIDGDSMRQLQALDLELIAGAVSDIATVTFVDDPAAAIDELFDAPWAGVGVVSIADLLLLDDRAEIELHLWCGPLCGVFLTYEAAPGPAGWEILGTTGPIAIS